VAPSTSTGGAASAAPPASTTSIAPTAPTWAWGGKPGMVLPSARPSSTASAPAPAPSCHVASYFDADGNKHFKQVCP
jgi:hypothetical protein